MQQSAKPPLNILIAYPYLKKDKVDFLRQQDKSTYRLIVDSGAFSAWSSGMKIELDDYCRFLDSIEDLRPFNAVQLDVFGDPEKSYQNFLTMKSRGYDVMPVFTRGETVDRLEEFYKLTDYIMFGGITTGGKNKNYLKWFMDKNGTRKVHWLGFTKLAFVKYYKPHSIDSSSWLKFAQFGNIGIYNALDMSIKSVYWGKFQERPEMDLVRGLNLVGATSKQISVLGHADAQKRARIDDDYDGSYDSVKGTGILLTTRSHIKQAVEIEKRIGTHVYLAASWPAGNGKRGCPVDFLFTQFEFGRREGLW